LRKAQKSERKKVDNLVAAMAAQLAAQKVPGQMGLGTVEPLEVSSADGKVVRKVAGKVAMTVAAMAAG
jgi:predicted regulator of Ras-like GTPase activity (Roadblock/LC7/MglB family)